MFGMKMPIVSTQKPGHAKLLLSVRTILLAIALGLSTRLLSCYSAEQFWSLAYTCCSVRISGDLFGLSRLENVNIVVRLTDV